MDINIDVTTQLSATHASFLSFEASTSIQELPEELVLHILSYLNSKDLASSSMVNQHWNRISHTFWEVPHKFLEAKRAFPSDVSLIFRKKELLEKIVTVLSKVPENEHIGIRLYK